MESLSVLEATNLDTIKFRVIERDYKHIIKTFSIQNRRYIGSKYKLLSWIFSIINKECKGDIFLDIFAGTGVVGAEGIKHFKKVILNDFLFSNYIIHNAFFKKGRYSIEKVKKIIRKYNSIDSHSLSENYFSINFGGKYFSNSSTKIIGFIREDIELNKNKLTSKEYSILITSLIYSIDKIANTVGHYDAYFKKDLVVDRFKMGLILPVQTQDISIFREDANIVAKKIKADIVYIDPPYNSRQYSRFYHILENLVKWDKKELYGTALKPVPENMSEYCKVGAKQKLSELVEGLDAKYLVVSYNNTYNSKSNSSKNKITLENIKEILTKKGKTSIFQKDHKFFNAGNTSFKDHKEFLFVTKVKNESDEN